MKTAFLILFSLCFAAGAFAQTPTDTIFLVKEKTRNAYHAVYIENNKSAPVYKEVLDFTILRDEQLYRQSIDYLSKKYTQPTQRYSTLGISGKWYPLYLYEGNYYLYAPCDYMNHHPFSIAFDGVTDLTPEGFAISRINAFSRQGSSYTFTLDGSFYGEIVRTIHVIDAEKGIAVIEERDGNDAPTYRLAVHSVTAPNFPLIVNDCRGEKAAEYEFAKPDYKTLLKNRK